MLTKEVAIRRLEKEGRFEDIQTIEFLSEETVSLYELDGIYLYFAGPLVPYTGMVKVYDIQRVNDGLFFLLPDKKTQANLLLCQGTKNSLRQSQKGKVGESS